MGISQNFRGGIFLQFLHLHFRLLDRVKKTLCVGSTIIMLKSIFDFSDLPMMNWKVFSKDIYSKCNMDL